MSLFILLLAPFFSLKTFTSIAFRLSYMHVYRPDQQITEPDKDNMLRFEVVINSLYYIPYFSFYFHTFSHFPPLICDPDNHKKLFSSHKHLHILVYNSKETLLLYLFFGLMNKKQVAYVCVCLLLRICTKRKLSAKSCV